MGSFSDGTITVNLDEFSVASITHDVAPLVIPVSDAIWSQVFEHGGDVFHFAVEHEQRYGSRAAAENAAYNNIYNLLCSTSGDLVAAAGTIGHAFFTGGEYRLNAECVLSGRVQFVASAPPRTEGLSVGNVYGAADTTGGAVSGIIVFNGTTLGDAARCEAISGQRQPVINRIPRADGAVIEDLRQGGQIQIHVRAWKACATRDDLEKYAYDTFAALSTSPGTLTLNGGSTLGNCFMQSPALSEPIEAAGYLDFTFIQGLTAGAPIGALTLKINGTPNTDWRIQGPRLNVLTGEEVVLTRAIRHDTASTGIVDNDLIEIFQGTQGVFTGWVRAENTGGVEREGVTVRAIGPKAVLMKERTARIGNPPRMAYHWNPNGAFGELTPGTSLFQKWNNGEIFQHLGEWAIGGSTFETCTPWLGTAGGPIASITWADLSVLDTELGEFAISATRLGVAWQTLVESQGQAVWYVEPDTLAVRVKLLTALPTVGLSVGVVGEHVTGGTAGAYVVISNPMSGDISQCYNVVVIEGRNQTIECRPVGLPGITLHGEAVTAGLNVAGCTMSEILGAGPLDDTDMYDHRLWQAPTEYRKWRAGHMMDDNADLYEMWHFSGALYTKNSTGGDLYEVNPPRLVNWENGSIIFASTQSYPYGLFAWFRCERPFSVTATSGDPVAGYTNELVIKTEEMEAITSRLPSPHAMTSGATSGGITFGQNYSYDLEMREDLGPMTTMGDRLVSAYAPKKWHCPVVIRGIDFAAYNIGKAIVFQNQDRWADIAFAILEVEADPATNTMRLQVSTDVLVSSLWGFDQMASKHRRDLDQQILRVKMQWMKTIGLGNVSITGSF